MCIYRKHFHWALNARCIEFYANTDDIRNDINEIISQQLIESDPQKFCKFKKRSLVSNFDTHHVPYMLAFDAWGPIEICSSTKSGFEVLDK